MKLRFVELYGGPHDGLIIRMENDHPVFYLPVQTRIDENIMDFTIEKDEYECMRKFCEGDETCASMVKEVAVYRGRKKSGP